MEDQVNIWPKHITVDKRIVKILSNSTYTNFPSAIREIIVNSYDADAENVWVDVDLKKEIISIRDDGKGMSEQDFGFYLRIAGKSRKKDSQITKAKRQIIGQFGVGFLSALPFCEKYVIETKKKDTEKVVHATIASNEYFKEDMSALDVEEIPIYGNTKNDPKSYSDQYTRIRLVGFSKLTKSFFKGEYSVSTRRNTINNYSAIELLTWDLSEYLPLTYNNQEKIGKKLNTLYKSNSTIDFNVHFNGKLLYRNIHASNILEISDAETKIGNIRFKYAILTDFEPINPSEARYLMVRNLNTGVGSRTTFDLGMDGKVYGKLAHITGEVIVSEGLNDLISVSRDKFNFSPDYEKLKEFLRQKLAKYANELDAYNRFEKKIAEFNDETKVHNLDSLKKDKVKHEVENLQSKGFNLKKVAQGEVKLNRVNREITVRKNVDDFEKIIRILNKSYKLVPEKWNYKTGDFPAIRIESNKVFVNESYPLFKNSGQFDTFLKLHILWMQYFQNKKIEKKVYKDFLSELLAVFNK